MEIQLVIKFVPGKPVEVIGPVADKILCYGLLAEARDAIQMFHARKGESKIEVARIIP